MSHCSCIFLHQFNLLLCQNKISMCAANIRYYWSPGLVVTGGDSCYKGCGFKSQLCILDRHFSYLFVLRLWCLLEQTKKVNEKEAVY